MSLEEDIDYTGYDAEKVERGDNCPAGWYRAMVQDVYEDRKNNNGTLVFEWQVVDGPYSGAKIFDRASNPRNAENANGERFALQRRRLLAKRLGLVNEFGEVKRVNWLQAIGFEGYLELATKEVKKQDGTIAHYTNVTFNGVYTLTDDRVPANVRGGAGSGPDPFPPSNGATGATAPLNPVPPSTPAAGSSFPGAPGAGTTPAASGSRRRNLDDVSV